jgi:HPt (histidine-containing phosphotransfer) domain-containing protein
MQNIEDLNVKIFDKEALMARLCDDEELANEVLDVFLEDTPHQIESLRAAQRAGDVELIARQGHTIKGASSNISALRLKEIAYDIEQAGKQGELDRVSELLGMLEEQFRELQKHLSR